MNITGNLSQKNCTTLFSNLNTSQTDKYFFRIENGPFRATACADPLQITVKDSAWSPTINISGVLREKESVTITCSASTPCPHSPPELTWNLQQHSHRQIEENTDGTFTSKIQETITLSDSHDGYNISCSVTYPVDGGKLVKSAQTEVTLSVSYAPKDTSASISPSGLVSAGSWVNLSCSSRAKPPVSSFTWFQSSKGGAVRVAEGHFYRLNVTEMTDTGSYYCVAANVHGNQTSSSWIHFKNEEKGSFPISSLVIILIVDVLLIILIVLILLWKFKCQSPQQSQSGRAEFALQKPADETEEEQYYGNVDFLKQRPTPKPLKKTFRKTSSHHPPLTSELKEDCRSLVAALSVNMLTINMLLSVFFVPGVLAGCGNIVPHLFITAPKNLEALSGSCLQIPCSFTTDQKTFDSRGTIYAIWMKNQRKPENVVYNSSKSENRYQMNITGNLSQKNCTTLFYHLNTSQTDKYFFRIENGPVRASACADPLQITVKDSAWSPRINISGDLKEKESVTITCSALTSCPHSPPELTWNLQQHSHRQIEENTDGTFISKIQETITLSDSHDGYNISCSVTYPVDGGKRVKSAQTEVTLSVSYAPKNTSVSISPSGLVSAGSWVNLSCSSRAKPPVSSFTWFQSSKGGAVRVAEGRFYRLNVTEMTDTGSYYCVAANVHGNQTSLWNHLEIEGVLAGCGDTIPHLFITAPKELEALSGSCLRIPCSFTTDQRTFNSSGTIYAIWMKNQRKPENVVYNSSKSENRYQMNITGILSQKICTTLFSNLNTSQTDTYFFRIENGPFRASACASAIRITVKDSSWSPTINISGVLKEKESVTITCSAFTPCPHSPPELTWNLQQHSHRQIEENTDGTFTSKIQETITLSDSHDGYNISCSVTYPVNGGKRVKSAQTEVTLSVSYAPKDTSASISPSGLVSAGSWVNLSCSSRAKPPVSSFTWFKSSKGGAVRVAEGHFYRLNVTEMTDTGSYYCVAANVHGNQTSSWSYLIIEAKQSQFQLSAPLIVVIVAMVIIILGAFVYLSKFKHPTPQQTESYTEEELPPQIPDRETEEKLHYENIMFFKRRPEPSPISEQDNSQQQETVYAQIK
ncbi:B-cell receptor CD22-like [Menidia menidia]